jgi:AcrR family transcriptional regulator
MEFQVLKMNAVGDSKSLMEKDESAGPGRIPVQKRGRERVEKILAAAREIITESGSDSLKMSDIVERTGVSFGSLYQYFPDKAAIIRRLAEHYNMLGRECVANELLEVGSFATLDQALLRIVDGYFEMYRASPVMCDIWHATQADKHLAAMEAEDGEWHSQTLLGYLKVLSARPEDELLRASRLTMQMIAAVVRFAITLPDGEAEKTLVMFKRGLIGSTERLIRET